ncbi:hypothetical protein TSTA_126170 [Talaromyces stipitatus ATCC 10500]|uniref:Uncharacterized protein n=1 Tax=Talaromyces stipitatus (strain ATCC 10500 / CBS 375.48 / QM 6759 / NRRL 1006) TaxID=441959 RepID=B8MBB9_TALSN|nr:uncharacterized protein TSTA_126170 [Talaromyces stipitatus ATCC 10500]EED18908.1 hypothetical protein TSTA_126170 [Talaromyces stipitatus ATCC 10500]
MSSYLIVYGAETITRVLFSHLSPFSIKYGTLIVPLTHPISTIVFTHCMVTVNMATIDKPEYTSPCSSRYICLAIRGNRKPSINEEGYRNHMVNNSVPMTKDLMVQYGVK